MAGRARIAKSAGFKDERQKIGELPQLAPTAFDDDRVRSLTQKFAGPDTLRLRRKLKEAFGRRSENPAVDALNKRRSLEGFGQGLADITSAAGQQAAGIAGSEFDAEKRQKELEFKASLEKEFEEFRARREDFQREEDSRDFGPSTSPVSPVNPVSFRSGASLFDSGEADAIYNRNVADRTGSTASTGNTTESSFRTLDQLFGG